MKLAKMSAICRVCLRTGCAVSSMIEHKNLRQAYEMLTGLTVTNDVLPPYLCYECRQRLVNCVLFRTQSLRAHLTLLQVENKHNQITSKTIKSTIGDLNSFQSTLSLSPKNIDSYDLDIEYKEKKNDEDSQPSLSLSNTDFNDSIDNINTAVDEVINDLSNVKVECEVDEKEGIKTEDDVIKNDHNYYVMDPLVNNFDEIIDTHVNHNENDVRISSDSFKRIADTIKCEDDVIDNENNLVEPLGNSIKEEDIDELHEQFSYEDISEDAYLSSLDKVSCNKERNNIVGNNIYIYSKKQSTSTHTKTGEGYYSQGLASSTVQRQLPTYRVSLTVQRRLLVPESKQETLSTDTPNVHRPQNENIEKDNFSCDLCAFVCSDVLKFLNHLKRHATKGALKKVNKEASSDNITFPCDYCTKTFTRECYLRRHIKKHISVKPYACKYCDKAFVEHAILQKHLKMHSGDKPFKCNLCEKAFTARRALIRHSNIHTKTKQFTCNTCSRTFYDQDTFRSHLRIHSDVKKYSCDICLKTFRKKSGVKSHLRTHFRNDSTSLLKVKKPTKFVCSHCGKDFSSKTLISKHLGTHLIVKPFSSNIHTKTNQFTCDTCSKTFYDQDTFKSHLRIHSDEKKYSCNICLKTCKKKSGVKSHLKIHHRSSSTSLFTVKKPRKKYVCNHCGKDFSCKTLLANHLGTHLIVKPFSCKVCSKSFAYRAGLRKHSIIHSERKLFSCDICNKKFTEKNYLHKHFRLYCPKKIS